MDVVVGGVLVIVLYVAFLAVILAEHRKIKQLQHQIRYYENTLKYMKEFNRHLEKLYNDEVEQLRRMVSS